jgi:hypothetical protein
MANTLAGNNNVNSYIGTQSKIKNLSPIAEIDRVNVYEFENGMDVELTELGGELTSENIRKAQAKVLKNLKKDPAFYTNQIAEETIKRFGEFGSGKKKVGKSTTAKDAEKVKADGGKAKVKPTDAPYGTKEEVKGKFKSSGMEPAKKVKGSLKESVYSTDGTPKHIIIAQLLGPDFYLAQKKEREWDKKDHDLFNRIFKMASEEGKVPKMKENMDYTISNQTTSTDPAEYRGGTTQGLEEGFGDLVQMVIDAGITNNYHAAQAIVAALGAGAVGGTAAIASKINKLISNFKKGGNENPMSEELDLNDPNAIKNTLKKQMSEPFESWETKLKKWDKEGKIKLTKDKMKEISDMVSEAVKTYKVKGRTGAETVTALSDQDKIKLQQAGNTLTDF